MFPFQFLRTGWKWRIVAAESIFPNAGATSSSCWVCIALKSRKWRLCRSIEGLCVYIFSATQCIHLIVHRQTGRLARMRRLLCLMRDRRAEQERENRAWVFYFSVVRVNYNGSQWSCCALLKMARDSGTISGTIQMKRVSLLLIVLLSFGLVTQRQSAPLQPAQRSNNKWVSTPVGHKGQGAGNIAWLRLCSFSWFLFFRSHLRTEQKRELSPWASAAFRAVLGCRLTFDFRPLLNHSAPFSNSYLHRIIFPLLIPVV